MKFAKIPMATISRLSIYSRTLQELMEEEILRAPQDPDLLKQRLRNNTAASPSDAGGDIVATTLRVEPSITVTSLLPEFAV